MDRRFLCNVVWQRLNCRSRSLCCQECEPRPGCGSRFCIGALGRRLETRPTDGHPPPGMIGWRAPGLAGLRLSGRCAGWLHWRLADLGCGRWCGECPGAGFGAGQGRRCAVMRCAPLMPPFSPALLRLLAQRASRSGARLRPSDRCRRYCAAPTWDRHAAGPSASRCPSAALRRPVCCHSRRPHPRWASPPPGKSDTAYAPCASPGRLNDWPSRAPQAVRRLTAATSATTAVGTLVFERMQLRLQPTLRLGAAFPEAGLTHRGNVFPSMRKVENAYGVSPMLIRKFPQLF